MRAKLLLRIPTAISIVSLSGCYPSFLTSRPEAEILVTDESGAPLEGAKVMLGTMERHDVGGRMTQADFLADSRGKVCLLYTSDAADERSSVDLGGRRIIK